MNVPPSNRCCVLYRFVTVARNRPLLPPPTLRQRSIGGSGTGLAHTFRAHAVSRISKLSRNLFHQNCMIPPGAVALDEVSCTIKGVGLGGGVADTYSHVRMERADRWGLRVVNSACRTANCRLSAPASTDIRASRFNTNLSRSRGESFEERIRHVVYGL